MSHKILVAYNRTEASEQAFVAALDLAQRFDTGLHIVAVASAAEVETHVLLDRLHAECTAFLEPLRARGVDANVQVDLEVCEGTPAREITAAASRIGAELIFIGHRRRGLLQASHRILGGQARARLRALCGAGGARRRRVRATMKASESDVAQYCGQCLSRLPADGPRCSECGAAAEGLNYRLAQQSLLSAIMRAPCGADRARLIRLIALRGEASSTVPLVAWVLQGTDRAEGLAVVECVERLPAGAARKEAMARLAQEHTSDAVRMAAIRALNRFV
ncbi:MAG TPA: universal stress protein [Burkholderiaceae bacterium]